MHLKRKILFVGHSASFTGAPRSLLGIISWLSTNAEFDLYLILREEGPLIAEYQKYAKVYLFLPQKLYHSENPILNIFRKIRLRVHRFFLLNKLKKESFGLIYCNTIVNRNVLEFLSPLNCKVITHVRELIDTINLFGGNELVRYIDNASVKIITISNACRDLLVKEFKVSAKKVRVINNFFLPPDSGSIFQKKEIYAELGIPENSFIVGSAGGLIWRKGPDLFILLARAILSLLPDKKIYFVWMGEGKKEMEDRLKMDIKLSGLEERVLFIGNKTNPYKYFNAFDIFTLMSREEPFGLVGLEAAFFQTPTLCFDKSGGMPEFVGDDAGFVVPYLDIQAMAEKVILLLSDEKKRKQLGLNAEKKAESLFNMEIQMKKIQREIEEIIYAV